MCSAGALRLSDSDGSKYSLKDTTRGENIGSSSTGSCSSGTRGDATVSSANSSGLDTELIRGRLKNSENPRVWQLTFVFLYQDFDQNQDNRKCAPLRGKN